MTKTRKTKKATPAPTWSMPDNPSKELVEAARMALETRRKRPVRAKATVAGDKLTLHTSSGDSDDHQAVASEILRASLGAADYGFAMTMVQDLERVVRPRKAEGYADSATLSAALAMVQAVAPRDEMEAAVAVQMVGTHYLAAEMLTKARSTDDRGALETYSNLAIKLMRTQTAQLEALAKLRSGGQQQVTVKHVYVNAQNAVVGDVHHSGSGGGGAGTRSGDQSHAPAESAIPGLPFAPGAEVWSADPQGDAVRVTGGGGAQEVQDARGHKPGRAAR